MKLEEILMNLKIQSENIGYTTLSMIKSKQKKQGGNIIDKPENYKQKVNYEITLSQPSFIFDLPHYITSLT